jgi:ABC-type multidrug transport system fused ATPase/permease subunit
MLTPPSFWKCTRQKWGRSLPCFFRDALEFIPFLRWYFSNETGETDMRKFYAYVWRSSASRQIVLIILAVMAALLAMAPLELQRHIINTLAGHEKAERLAWLCGAYLIAALSIGGLKYLLNIKSAGLGESMILSLRNDIFRSTSPLKSGGAINETATDKAGTFVAMIATEAEAVGKFVGDCISTPTVQAGTLLSVLGYMLYTEPLLGLVVLFIAVPQVFAVEISVIALVNWAGSLGQDSLVSMPSLRYLGLLTNQGGSR